MYTIKCSRCKSKIIKYKKIGSGKVLRCFKERIDKYYQNQITEDLVCNCGQVIGIDKGRYYKMKQNNFIYNGTVIK